MCTCTTGSRMQKSRREGKEEGRKMDVWVMTEKVVIHHCGLSYSTSFLTFFSLLSLSL